MKREYTIIKEEDHMSVYDLALSKGISKRALKDIKLYGDILINGDHVRVVDKVSENDIIEFIYPKEESDVIPWEHDLAIVYEDEGLIIIDKEAGIPCIPTRGHRYHTVANALKYYYDCHNIEAAIHLVNRLDKDTSGLMLVAKNRDLHYQFSKDIKQVKRVYHCLVEGKVTQGVIDAPILKLDKEMRRIIDDRGKKAITHYRCIEYKEGNSLVECVLETGRTHQIRVHMASIGHPLIGDTLYGGREGVLKLQSVELSFVHPITKEYIDIKKQDL